MTIYTRYFTFELNTDWLFLRVPQVEELFIGLRSQMVPPCFTPWREVVEGERRFR